MKTKYPNEIIDLRHQPDHITSKQIQLIQEYGTDPDNARLFVTLISRREIEILSDRNKLIEIKVIKMKILNFKDFMKKYNLKNDTMNESDLQRVYKYNIYPRDSKINSDKGFVNIDNGSQSGTHWTCFVVKNNKSYHFDSFGVYLINFYSINYLNQ